jgi:hypothetical protein
MKKKASRELELLGNDIINTPKQLEKEKNKIIGKLKGLTKEDILPKPPEPPKQLTLWERIKKVLMG